MIIFSFLNQLVDLLVAPFHGLGPIPQLVLLSLVSTVALLAAFKRLSNQETIRSHKNKIFGNFLEIAIYRDQFRRSLICQGRILKYNLLYLGAIGKPLLLLMIPMILVCLQLEYRLGYQTIKPGQSFIIEAQLEDTASESLADITNPISIITSDTIDLETPAMRIPATDQIFWKARLIQDGSPNFISIMLPGQSDAVRKDVAIGKLTNRFTPKKTKIVNLGNLVDSGEDGINSSSPIKTLRVAYSPAEYPFLRWTFSPIVYYFILTLLFGALLKPVMKVSI
ncbi:MAG: hypothetical protein KKD63_01985 [Proteobacteria bacterium]|nr:hypothetical protein [Desulfobulbaceae bacterium]MBU4151630.1 hypothetical protein [Pseudomonadota bacterium]